MSISPRRAWSGTERVLVRDNYRSKGAGWCAQQIGRSRNAVRMFALKNGFGVPLKETRRPSSPLIDGQIRRAYAEGRGAVVRLAKAIGYDAQWIARRASELGLSMRPGRCQPFTAEEAAFVEAHAHLNRQYIARLMREKGWQRTGASVQKFISHHRISDNGDYISATGLVLALGAGESTILSWVRAGELIAQARDGEARPGGWRVYALTEVARFAVQHPHRIDMRKVDGPWLIDLLARYGSLGLIEPKGRGERIVALDALGKSNAEIATILDTTVGSVSVTLSRHRAKARKQGEAA